MLRLVVNSLLLAAVSAAPAQQARSANASSRQFSDSTCGVTFCYPARWSANKEYKFYSPLSITSQQEPLSGNVFFSSKQGFNPYPQTNLTGVQFAYATTKASSGQDCLKQTLKGDGNAKMLAPKSINGISYSHAQTSSAGMCHQIEEDIYAASRNGTCYLFDLAVHTTCPGVVDNMREITKTEIADVHSSLEKILSSVQISDVKKD